MTKKAKLVDNLIRVNELIEEGYECLTMNVHTYHDDVAGGVTSVNQYLMILKDKGYSDVVEVRDAPQDDANKLLALNDGWVISSTSVSSKFYRMVKRGEDPLRNALKEWIASDGELDSVISIVEDYC